MDGIGDGAECGCGSGSGAAESGIFFGVEDVEGIRVGDGEVLESQ